VPTYTVIQMPTLSDEHVVGTVGDLDPSFDPTGWRQRGLSLPSRPVMVGGSFTDFVPVSPDVLASFVHAVGYFGPGSVLDLGVGGVSEANAMNSRGTVVGYIGDYAFRFARGSWTILPGVGYGHAVATGVNSSGIVVGYESRGWGHSKSLYWTPDDQVHELAIGSSELSDINEEGVVAGYRFSGAAFTMKLDGGGPTLLAAPFSGTPCWAESLNDAGDVVGEFSQYGAMQPVLWSHGRVIPLPVLPNEGTGGARASDVNNHGVVVGGSNWGKAVVWIDRKIYDLNELTPDYAPFLKNARAVNDFGVIACESDAGATRAVLLIPNP